DIFAAAFDGGLILGAREAGLHLDRLAGAFVRRRGGNGSAQPRDQAFYLLYGFVVGFAGVVAVGDVSIAEDFDAMADVIEDEEGVGKEEAGVVRVQFVGVLV